jgi:UDP-N-acetylglucosamine 2-epimerase (non-hydrolysing)
MHGRRAVRLEAALGRTRRERAVKVVTILGTRPEVIRLCRVVEKLDGLCEQVIIHTGQNYDPRLNDVFFEELGVRAPDHHLGARGSFGEQLGTIVAGCERILRAAAPDRFLVLGDTNSSLGAVAAKRLSIPVYHMEAGNRCYDDRVPEEVNRRIIDHSSDVLLPYTESSRQNLLREGIPRERTFVTGNPILEVMEHFADPIAKSGILAELGLRERSYFLVTLHRAENVDVEERLVSLTGAFERIARHYDLPVVVSTHPRTRARLAAAAITSGSEHVRYLEPFGFFDFVHLEREAACVLSDSGTVQEETCILGVPNVTLRDVTERPETLDCGSGMLVGADPERILLGVEAALAAEPRWEAPPEYLRRDVSDTVVRILLGHRHARGRA